MKTFSHKRSRKRPVVPEKEKPFFSPTATTQEPFFNSPSSVAVQPKLTIGKPNDAFEQEADAMAASVANQSRKPQAKAQTEQQIHRRAMQEEEPNQTNPELMRMEQEEEPAQTKPELMRMEQEEEPAQTKPELMRMEQEEEPVQAQSQEEEPVQTKSESGHQAKADLSQGLKTAKGQGQPLPARIQKKMAQAFNCDFSDVTIHTGSEAVQMTRELKAQAFTHGKDIYFNEGKYNPESSSGEELLVHELTHVVQQNPPQFTTQG